MTAPEHRPPPLDRLLAAPALQAAIARHGREPTLAAARAALAAWRSADPRPAFDLTGFETQVAGALERQAQPSLKPVFNLTGTVLHTNLGRAVLAPEAVEAVAAVMRGPSNLEYALERGARGDRDEHLESLLCELTGAEAATAVNNNAAAVLLVLNTLANRREVPLSRGELVEIGGAFRIPDVMRRAGARLIEVGTTNRTHLRDFEHAIGPRTALLLKVHTSNFAIHGFTSGVSPGELAALAARHGLPMVEDLGSGTLVDLARWGLPPEPTPRQSITAGAGIVTFSGDKLLGGPQAGLIVGDKALVQAIRRNPLKRALRLDKMTLAALEATLRLYRDPDRLALRLPTLRLLTRTPLQMQPLADRLAAALAAALGDHAQVQVLPCRSQIGSGSLPVDRLDSLCVAIAPPVQSRRSGGFADRVAEALRDLPVPVVGRIEDGAVRLDLRGLEEADEAGFVGQLGLLAGRLGPAAQCISSPADRSPVPRPRRRPA